MTATAVNPAPPAPQRYEVTAYELASPPTGEHFAFATSSRSGDGLFRFVWTLAPGKKGPGQHVHPDETEAFEVVSGTLRIWIAGEPHDLRAGDKIAVPPGTPHRFLNPEKVPCVVNVALDGPRMEDTFLPAAIANHQQRRKRNLLRFFVTTPVHRASIPTSRIASGISWAIIGLLRLFRVKPFEPAVGWDGPSAPRPGA